MENKVSAVCNYANDENQQAITNVSEIIDFLVQNLNLQSSPIIKHHPKIIIDVEDSSEDSDEEAFNLHWDPSSEEIVKKIIENMIDNMEVFSYTNVKDKKNERKKWNKRDRPVERECFGWKGNKSGRYKNTNNSAKNNRRPHTAAPKQPVNDDRVVSSEAVSSSNVKVDASKARFSSEDIRFKNKKKIVHS